MKKIMQEDREKPRTKSIKAIKEKFKEQGVYYTSEKLAKTLLSYVDIKYQDAYDPTCGRGNLLSVLSDEIMKYGQELDEDELEYAIENIPNFIGKAGDTLSDDKFKGKKFDLILGNPPFSIKWNPDILKEDERFKVTPKMPPKSKADYAFLLHILYHLKDDGQAIVLNFPGILYRGNAEGIIRKWMVENNFIDKVVLVPPKSFEDTNISTAILVIKKNRTTTDVVFEDLTINKKRTVKLDEIKENDYKLSVNSYVYEEVKKEEHNPLKEQLEIRKTSIQNIKNAIEFDFLVCSMDKNIKPDTRSYILGIRKVADEYLERLYGG